jgi:tRNA threonylcarbamoyladenosine biosynthesis protein TsaB
MIVLGIDTATAATAVALGGESGPLREARDDPPAGAHPGHATRLLAMVDELLGGAGLELGDVQRIAVGVGPGTFTGLRVGIATARALAQSAGSELVGVSSLAALAAPALSRARSEERTVLATIDARRREVFAAPYSPGGELLAGAQAIAPAGIGGLVEQSGAVQPLGVGDGALRYRAELEAAGVEVPEDGSPLHRVTAAAICELGQSGAGGDYAEVLPEYLRRPDAELALQAAGGGRS